MVLDSIPELPYDSYHKFLAVVGIGVVILSLFLEPVFLESQDIFLMGTVAATVGVVGWVIERISTWRIRRIMATSSTGRSGNRKISAHVHRMNILRILLLVSFIALEAWVILSLSRF